ncbi:Amino acid permease [Quillaja saponaria]|uniref:Amino acid permease n=1 Tax=Quillaja saponaria TaxID=32244 RepID=A0AAD7M0A4_QUISA|nr:Amino acid permease [Quillaja saponaria]
MTVENGEHSSKFDDDGHVKRTGTLVTASAHIVTAVIGSGVLSLGWAVAQLGPLTLFSGRRNYNYMEVVKNNLGGTKYLLCGIAQYGNLVGISIGYTITASISMVAIKRSNCFHMKGHDAGCHSSNNPFMIFFGIIQIILSQIPNFHELSWLSILAAIMSFGYSFIGLGLSIAKVAGGNHVRTSLTGTTIGVDVTSSQKMWNTFQAMGNIAFAYAFSMVIVEIQDTLKSSPPENQVMKKAAFVGISITTVFYMSCGILGYAAFGNLAAGNFLTGFGFYEPFWLVDIGNLLVVIHLVGAYQVFCQPIFGIVESSCSKSWPESKLMAKEYRIGSFNLNVFRLIFRTAFVIMTTVVAMLLPFFTSILGLLGAGSFWPLTVFFPTEMYISRAKIPKFSLSGIGLRTLSGVCLIVSLIAAAGSIQGIVKDLQTFKPFHSVS